MNHNSKFLTICQTAKQQIKEVDIEAAVALLETDPDIILIDVREESEWTHGHLPNAIHLSKGVIERDIEKVVPNPEQTLLLYCGGGFRSALAAVNLQQMGYKKVISMDGGFRSWVEAGLPIED